MPYTSPCSQRTATLRHLCTAQCERSGWLLTPHLSLSYSRALIRLDQQVLVLFHKARPPSVFPIVLAPLPCLQFTCTILPTPTHIHPQPPLSPTHPHTLTHAHTIPAPLPQVLGSTWPRSCPLDLHSLYQGVLLPQPLPKQIAQDLETTTWRVQLGWLTQLEPAVLTLYDQHLLGRVSGLDGRTELLVRY